ncbi:MAG: glycoside hydrolase family 20 zincin-like fold domain-containing protein, partial [Tidjanibacter sp.]|nr:glycoside hydrolase family 20 zincin-like fold domain-containing protein [Tidjanibacter sp.]
MKKFSILAALLCAASLVGCSVEPEVIAEEPVFLPLPVEVTPTEGSFVYSPKSAINFSAEVEPIADYLDEYLGSGAQKGKLVKTGKVKKGSINLSVNPNMDIPAEGYRLTIDTKSIIVEGKDYGGVFNGVQTLLQV